MITMGCKFRYSKKKNTGSSECCLTRAPGRCWLAPWEHISAQKMWGSYGRKTQTPHVYGRITMVFYGYGLWFMVMVIVYVSLTNPNQTSNLCCGLRSTGQAIQGFLPGDWALPLSWNLKNRPLFLANYDVWLWFTVPFVMLNQSDFYHALVCSINHVWGLSAG